MAQQEAYRINSLHLFHLRFQKDSMTYDGRMNVRRHAELSIQRVHRSAFKCCLFCNFVFSDLIILLYIILILVVVSKSQIDSFFIYCFEFSLCSWYYGAYFVLFPLFAFCFLYVWWLYVFLVHCISCFGCSLKGTNLFCVYLFFFSIYSLYLFL